MLPRFVFGTGGMSSATLEFYCVLSCPCFKPETIASVKALTLESRVVKLETIASDKVLTLEFKVAISALRAINSSRVCPHSKTFTSTAWRRVSRVLVTCCKQPCIHYMNYC
jgi:hypothetical protein